MSTSHAAKNSVAGLAQSSVVDVVMLACVWAGVVGVSFAATRLPSGSTTGVFGDTGLSAPGATVMIVALVAGMFASRHIVRRHHKAVDE